MVRQTGSRKLALSCRRSSQMESLGRTRVHCATSNSHSAAVLSFTRGRTTPTNHTSARSVYWSRISFMPTKGGSLRLGLHRWSVIFVLSILTPDAACWHRICCGYVAVCLSVMLMYCAPMTESSSCNLCQIVAQPFWFSRTKYEPDS